MEQYRKALNIVDSFLTEELENSFGEVSNLKVNPFEIYLFNKNENIIKDYRFAVGSKILSQSILNELE
ncbi:hypothetical protein KQA50_14120 [Staphylococcus aureus]|uniref:hypothetical protein n=1 Tax=Staphylococcus aureus TaxID=1280 RepID=UPI001C1EE962|nr:hypothetical protein [Staphylococcus aureus]MBU6915004.1 hypothetical protein [Staphylococcus aureus]MBU6925897.1 hypothetical protein [Staphylococcus aureus]